MCWLISEQLLRYSYDEVGPMPVRDELCDCRVIHEDRIKEAELAALADHEIDELSQMFKALADSSRLKILWALENKEMCVCDLAALLRISESAVSHQLRLLRVLRLVANRRQGAVLYYRLADDHVSQLIRLALQHVRE